MKKFLCLILCLFMLAGCAGSKTNVTPILKGITFTARVNYYNEVYECETAIDQNGGMVMTVTVPEDISGMKLTFSGDNITAEYMGLSYTPRTESLPVGSIAQMLYSILRDLGDTPEMTAKDEQNCIYDGRINDRAYSFCCAPSGLPLYIEIPDDSFRIEFSGVTIT